MPSEKITKEEPGITDFVYRVANTVQETEDNFIFQTLCNFGAQTYDIIVDKKELCAALQLVRHMREKGINIFECEATATSYSNYYRQGYDLGYREGYSKGYTDAMNNASEIAEQKSRLGDGSINKYERIKRKR